MAVVAFCMPFVYALLDAFGTFLDDGFFLIEEVASSPLVDVTPETIEAAHILIQPEKPGDKASEQKAETKAKAILAQLKQGADFGVLAETESACPSGKRSKGSLGKMGKEGLDKDFWNAAFALKKGETSGVVKTQFGYHIIRLDNKEEGKPIKFEEVKNDIVSHLKSIAMDKKVKEAVEAAKKNGLAKISNF